MEINRKLLLIIFSIFFLIFTIQAQCFSFVFSYWGYGEGDCKDFHGVTHLDVYYDPSAVITLDGKDDESFWHVSGKNNSRIIPVAAEFGTPEFFIRYVYMSFVRSDTHLFILVRWNDSTVATSTSNWDQFSICWNINMENYTAGLYKGMKTEFYGGGDVDTWQWGYRLGKENGSSYSGYDACFGDEGWYPHDSELSQVDTGMIYGNWINATEQYQIEISRPLMTGEIYDVQFNENKAYEFSIAILDNDYGTGEGEDHAISWTLALHFSNFSTLVISGIEIKFLFLSIIIFSGLFIFWKRKRIIIKKN